MASRSSKRKNARTRKGGSSTSKTWPRVGVVGGTLAFMSLPAVAAHADTTAPTVVNDNAVTCAAVGLGADSQVGADGTGSASADGLAGVVTGTTTLTLTGPSNVIVDGVVIKGGSSYNLYSSPTLPFTGTAPLVGSGNLPKISHWFACYRLAAPDPGSSGGTTGGTTDTTGGTTDTTGGTTDTTGGTTDTTGGTTTDPTGGTTPPVTDPSTTTDPTTTQQSSSTPAVVVPPVVSVPAVTTPTTTPVTTPVTAPVASAPTSATSSSAGSTAKVAKPHVAVSGVTVHHPHHSTSTNVLGTRATHRSATSTTRPRAVRRVTEASVLGEAATRPQAAAQLPFTGVDVLPMVDGGIGAIILGALTLRLGRRRPARHAG